MYPSNHPPLYVQLREIIRSKIESGEYAPAMAIPSELELAETYETNRQTVRIATEALVNEGLLRRVPGRGVFVLGKKMERDLVYLEGFTQTMLNRKVQPSFKVIKKMLRPAGGMYSLMFHIKPDDEIYYIKRLCYADNEPISLEEIYIPYYLVPKINGIDLSIFSVYDVYAMYNIHLKEAKQTLDLVHLEQNEARLLGVDAQLPVMLFECTSYDDKGRAIEFVKNYTRGDKCNFTVKFQH